MFFFFFNDTATTEIYTLSLHDALPILVQLYSYPGDYLAERPTIERLAETVDKLEEDGLGYHMARPRGRSEEHTSELQSRQYLVCRLLLEKKKPFFSSFPTHSPPAHLCS